MIGNIKWFISVIVLFVYSSVFSQGICSYSESSFGEDATNSVEFNSFECVDTVTNAFVTSAELTVGNLGGQCPSWYYFDLSINGSTVDEDLCSLSSVDLSSYGVDVNALNSVLISSSDGDGISDDITLDVNLDLTYIVTSCPPPSPLTGSNIEPYSATVHWQSNGVETLWNLELVNLTLGEVPLGMASNSGVSVDSFNLTGLLPENDYAIYVQSDCGPFNPDAVSVWSLPILLSTPPACFSLGPIIIDDLTDSSVTLSWLQAGSEMLWDVELINVSIGDTFTFFPNYAALGNNSTTITGLNPGSDYQFIVRADCGIIDGVSDWTVPYSFSTLPTCIEPLALEVVSFNYQEIKVNWVAQDTETEWYTEVVYITGGESQTGIPDDSTMVNEYTAIGLVEDSEYQIYIAANCGEDGISEWIGPLTVTTDCDPLLAPYIYDVETQLTTVNSSIEGCWRSEPTGTSSEFRWDVDGSGSTPSNGTGPSGAFSGLNYFYVEASSGEEGDVASLYSQYVDISTLSSPGLSFMYHMYGGNTGSLSIDINDNGIWFLDVFSIVGEQQTSGVEEWVIVNINLATYNDNIQVRFRATRGDGLAGDISIDDISINEGIGCYAPSSLSVDSLGGNWASVSWNDNNSSVPLAGWTIEYGAGGFVTGSGTEFPTGGSFFLLTGLSPGETYDFHVRAHCTPGIDTSEWSTDYTFTTPCAPFVVPYFYDVEEQITTVNSDLFINCWTATPSTGFSWDVNDDGSTGSSDTGPDDAFSGDKYYFTEATNGDPGDEAELITPEFNLTSLTSPILQFRYHMYGSEMGTLHIDIFDGTWNNDEFSLIGEQHSSGDEEWSLADVDLSTYSGVVKVRFRAERGEGFHGDISLDDIQIREQPTCFPPIILIDSITTTTVSFTLDSIGTNGSLWYMELINLSLGEVPTGMPTDSLTSLSFILDNLPEATDYELFLFTDCDPGSSDPTSVVFQTDCAPSGDFFKDWEDLSALSGGNDTSVCWTYLVESVSTIARIYVSSSIGTLAHSPTNFIRMYNQSDIDADLLLITPELIDIDSGTHVFTFWARSSIGDSPFEVGTIADITDPNTFTSLFSGMVSDVYDSITVPLLSYTGADKHIAIKFNPVGIFDYLFVDDVRWEAGPSCALPVNFSILDFTNEEVTVDWLHVSPDNSWGVELINLSLGEDFSNEITDTAYSHPFTITGLNENSIYGMKLTNSCDTFWTQEIVLVTPFSNDVGISNIISPFPNDCSLGDSTQMIVEVSNYGGQPQVNIPIELSWDDINYFPVGSLVDTLYPGESLNFTLSGFYDFSSALDSNFYVQTVLVSDSLSTNNMTSSSVTNLGDQLVSITVNTSSFANEIYWKVRDSLNNIYVFEQAQGYSNNSTFQHDVCLLGDSWYVMEAYDSFGDGWNGGTYEITRCGGIVLANNNGDEVTNGGGGFNPDDLEVQESFYVESCPDNDLALLSIDSIFSACGLEIEIPYVSIMNFGNLDVSSLGATAQYNYGGGWIDFWDFSGGLLSQSDTIIAMPSLDMSLPGQYVLQVQLLFVPDEDTSSNTFMETIISVPNLIEDSASFELDFGGWTSHLSTGVNNSWEWGIPTSVVAGAGNDGKVWATNLAGDAALNEESYLLSPCYDFSSYTNELEVSYDFVRVSIFHFFRLEYELNDSDTWNLIENVPSNITEWTHQITLLNLAGEASVRFRWFYDSSFNNPIEGFSFDNWEIIEHILYTDATLSELAVNGDTVSDPVVFDPMVFNYNYEVPYGTTLFTVTAAINAPFFSSLIIEEPLTLPGQAVVTVTAEDTSFVNIYTVNIFETPASTDATLSGLTVSNSAVAAFHPDTLCYDVVFPAGSTFMPTILAAVNDPNAIVQINNTNIPGIATIIVTAEDGITTRTYCVNYVQSILSTDATLSDLSLDGLTITGFNSDSLEYTVILADTVTVVPFITYTTNDVNAMAVLSSPGALPGIATIIVTAEDGFTMLVYAVNILLEPSTNANLLDLSVDGSTISGFHADSVSYNEELPFGTSVPVVVGVPEDNDATVVVLDASSIPGTTTVTVTAEDGSTAKIYFINFTYGAPNNNADLSFLSSNIGSLSPVFHADSIFYINCVGDQQFDIAQLTLTLVDINATWQYLSEPQTPYEDYIIEVTAQDGVTVKVYTVDLNECWPIGLIEEFEEKISISPNPSNGAFMISLPVDDVKEMKYVVIDQLGKVISEKMITNPGNDVTMYLNHLPSGVYSLYLTIDGEQLVKKISILK